MHDCMRMGAVKGVLCADGHYGYSQPVGGVVAYDGHISISGVGFDIACGNKAIKTSLMGSDLTINQLEAIADEIQKQISFGVGRVNDEKVESYLFDSKHFFQGKFLNTLKDMATKQLGTVGSGNHYVDVFIGSDNYIWIGCHFGSRGLGHKIATEFMKRAGAKKGMDAQACVVSDTSDIGEEYLHAMELAGKYAYDGRDWVCDKVLRIIKEISGLDAEVLDSVHNHHNYAWKEKHNDNLWVVRKGATPAFHNQRGFVGGSMGDISVILHGIKSQLSEDSLYSTIHGAGRVMGRMEAAGKTRWIEGKKVKVSEGKVNEKKVFNEIKSKGIFLRGGGADEAPEVYKNIEDVLDYHKDSIEIETVLNPVIVVMAGNDYDPYKD